MSVEYDVSLRNLFDRLNIQVEEVPDWICCGTNAAPSTSRFLGLSVPLLSIARAVEAGQEAVLAPCSACLYHFKSALHQLQNDPALVPQVEEILDLPLTPAPDIMHPVELLSSPAFEDAIREAVVKDLSDLKVVCYYGCLMTRPPKVMQFDVAEYPQSMDRLIGWTGARTLDWACKTECCGATFSMIDSNVVIDLSRDILNAAKTVGADAIVVACPLCQVNLDSRQAEIETRFGEKFNLPILFFSQLLGLAFDIPEDGLGLWRHMVDVDPMTECLARVAPESESM
jgi:heterodisulfide reductase subunit B